MTARQFDKNGWISKFCVLGATALIGQSAVGQTQTSALSCPESIQEKSIRLVDMPTGWAGFIASPLYLHGAVPTSGPPEKLGELSDYKQRRGKDEWVYTYELDGQFPDGKWLACTYGESDQVVLSQRLDDGVRRCTFTYRKGKHVGQHGIVITCTK